MFKKNKTKKINKAKKKTIPTTLEHIERQRKEGARSLLKYWRHFQEEGSRSKRMFDILISIETLDLLI